MSQTPALTGSALEEAGAVITETSLRLTNPATLTWEQYERLGNFLGTLGQAYCWWVGDFLIYGEEIFGEEFAQIEKALPHSRHTLENYASIAKRIPPNRRRHGLSFGVHETVAYLEPQARERLLDEAQEHGWKREEMRSAKRAMFEPVAEISPPELCPHCGRPM